MPRAIPVPEREVIVGRIEAGEPVAAVAEDLGMSYWTVRRLWRRYRDGGPAALPPDYARCGRPGVRADRLLYRSACWLRRRHPGWGAGLIRTLLADRYPDRTIPHERTLRRWFAEAGLTAPPRPPREPPPPRATAPHETWQLDAKEQIPLADGSKASWLLATDEASGATLTPVVFPQGTWAEVSPTAVQAAVRRFFAAQGRPRRFRVDNGAPWGAAGGDLPTALELWLWGLDVNVVHNRPRRCTENGRVERTHGVLARWAEPGRCASADALQTALTAASAMQRAGYPARRGRSRAAAYPALAAGGRPYDPAREGDLFDEHRVWARLAKRTWRRRVDKVGRISVYNRPLGVGRARAGQDVILGFDADTVAWVIRDAKGTLLRTHPAPELSRERLLALDVAHRRPQRPAPAKPHDHPRRANLTPADTCRARLIDAAARCAGRHRRFHLAPSRLARGRGKQRPDARPVGRATDRDTPTAPPVASDPLGENVGQTLPTGATRRAPGGDRR